MIDHSKIILIMIILTSVILGQNVPRLQPVVGEEYDFTDERISKFNSIDAIYDCQQVWKKMDKLGLTYDELSAEDLAILHLCGQKRSIWQTVSDACDWSCMGGKVDSVSASSVLSSQGENNYSPQHAYDFSYRSAWVEGVSGYGIGEYLIYHFTYGSLQFNTVIISNGYVKSRIAWESNSRVKKLKVYYNDKPIAILELEDVYADQIFKVGVLGIDPTGYWENSDRWNETWNIKFEILDVYKGFKYEDTVISEIFFDRDDLHSRGKNK